MQAQDYITQAVAQSYDNRPDVLFDGGTELLVQLGLIFAKYYRIAAKQNPGALSTTAVLTWSAGGWDIPAGIDTVIRLEPSGFPDTEVVVVPIEDRRADPTAVCVYRLGRRYRPAGNATDPSNQNLLAYYASVGPTFTTLTDATGPEWPVQFDPMVIYAVAAFLAAKDSRVNDAGALVSLATEWEADYRAWLQTPDLNVRRRFGLPTQIPTPAVRAEGTG